jgi:cytochrome c
MPRIDLALIAACFAFSAAAYAQSGEEFAKSKCSACHAVDQKKVGPSLKEISAARKGDKKAEGDLVGFLKRGKGHPKIEASDAQLKAVIQYVLKQ